MAASGVHTSFWGWAEGDPSRIAVIENDGATVTYAELAARAHQTAHRLKLMGLKAGDAIVTLLKNRSDCLELFLAALNCGWYYVPINHHGTADDFWWILDNAEAKALFTEADFHDRAREAADRAGLPMERRISRDLAEGWVHWDDVRAGQPVERPDSSVAGQVMQYTSGTTGRPKGVRRPVGGVSADASISALSFILGVYGMEPGDGAHLVCAPMYHSAVHSISVMALHYGQAIVMMEKWTPEECLQKIARYRITSSHMVATHFHRLLQLPQEVRDAADVSSLTHILHGAVPTPVETKRRMIEWWGPVIHEYYGSSEVGGTFVKAEDWLKKPGTVGKPFSISEIKIRDEDGVELGVGQIGSIWMRQGEQNFSYYKDEAKTAKNTFGQFIHVGDYGYVDQDGYLFLSGRDAEIIISGGVNIYPAAVEGRLLEHPWVRDCGVVGAPNAEYGEEVKAVVSLNPPAQANADTERELIDFCRSALSHIVCPRSIDFVDELDRDPSGKLRKRQLRDRYWPKEGSRL
ncbi:MAG: AMP-binding protein [Bordetella sp.]|nr:AMP-binding protein [Bordetella sp.]